jgi:hypothetical protein
MRINLRKASAIQSEIQKILATTRLDADVSVTEYEANVEEFLYKATVEFAEKAQRVIQLNNCLYNMRHAVASANAQAVNHFLTEIERTNRLIAVAETISKAHVMKPITEIRARLEKLAKTDESSARLYGRDHVTTSAVTQELVDGAKGDLKALKRTRQELQDKLLAENINTTIELNDEMVVLLKEEGLL